MTSTVFSAPAVLETAAPIRRRIEASGAELQIYEWGDRSQPQIPPRPRNPGLRPHPGAGRAREFAEQGTRPLASGGLEWKWDPQVVTTWMSNAPEASEERWSWVTCPALILTAALANEFWSGRRGEHEEIAEAGHMVHYDAPEQLVQSIRRFLNRLPAA